jgi:site-specific recombinase XerD
MTQSRSNLEEILETQIQTLALTLQPGTVRGYRSVVRGFLTYLHRDFPQVRRLAQLRRDPHILGWFRWICEKQPPIRNGFRINCMFRLRRLLNDLAANGHVLQPDLIRREDFPPKDRYLPRALSLQEDSSLQQELRRIDTLKANALLLTRAIGLRIGECINLPLDCLREIGPGEWAVHIPIGKMHNERLVPADSEVRRIVARILTLRSQESPKLLAKSQNVLLPRKAAPDSFVNTLRYALDKVAKRIACPSHVTPHRLRHSFASEMIRLGVSLPALMQLLGHKDIQMTLRYVQVTQQDLQREYRQARNNAAQPHQMPVLPLPKSIHSTDLPGIHQALEATRHLMEMYRRQLSNEKSKRTLQRLDHRLLAVASQLKHLGTAEK